ncbi:Ig-like domain-containing protein [Chryseobacterium balustinum]|uniref:Ig-like domain-containing protein n=1 Tax=Chryseobacterium balustinum TaxID=246 RepID=UPI003CEA9A1E
MNAKLNNITTQYRKFNPSQVLTEGQLNEFIDYFEDQDRLSRTRLSGVGVVCGFKSTFIDLIAQPEMMMEKAPGPDTSLLHTLEIKQGVGVTTDGDLVTLRQKGATSSEVTINFDVKNYKYYREYTDKFEYKHFRIEGQQEPLWELITEDEYKALGTNTEGFKLLYDFRDTIYNKVIILYLESYSNEENPCQDADCDNAGAEQVSNLKVLLADSGSVTNLIARGDAKDTIYKAHNAYEELFNGLPKIEAKRVILDADVKTAFDLKARFQNATDTAVKLSNGFGSIADMFKVSVNLGGQTLINKLTSLFENTSPRLEDYQYRYDLQKDLIDTYNEIKGLILHLDVDCCPSINSFPKHLLLGSVGAKLEVGDHNRLRHSFYNSPVTTNDDEHYERIIMLANRFVQKINRFQAYIGPIKITPSRLDVRLGDKAIPYYYNVNKPLLTQWNFEKTKTDRETYNLSYHTTNLAVEDFVQNPLNYNIDDNDFYRIEGHLGMPFETAYQNINDLKRQYGLAFDVIVLLLNKGEKSDTVEKTIATEVKTVSIEGLRKQLMSISSDISRERTDSKSALLSLSKLDSQLKLLNKVDFARAADPTKEEVTIVKEDPRKEEITSELLSDFLERKSGLEHLAGVERGGAFVLICGSTTNNQVLADFSLPYLCCSKEKPNVPPIALDDKASCMLGKTVVIPVLSNDYDADNDILTVVKKSNPSHGTVVLNSDNTFTYTHDGSSNLSDSFTYCVNDGRDDSNIATVFISVKSAPVAINDHATTQIRGYVDIAVKDNDYDLGNTPLTVFIKTQPTYGTATLNGDGTIKYTHNGASNTTDSFTYYINDGELDSNIATVTITIAPPPCDSGMDVVFIFDYTGSMSSQIGAAKAGANSIISTIATQSGSKAYRLGLVLADEYGSGTASTYHTAPSYTSLPASQKFINAGVGSRFQWITAMEVMSDNNSGTFTNQLNKLNNSGAGLSLGSGYGTPEPTDMALSRVVEHNFAGTFRNNVAKYIILITDAVPGGNDDNATSLDVVEMNRLKNVCLAKSIKVIVLGSGVNEKIDGKFIWKDLADGTGGSWNSSYNASAIQSAIINGCGGTK